MDWFDVTSENYVEKITDIEDKLFRAVTIRLFTDNNMQRFSQEISTQFDTKNESDITALVASGIIVSLIKRMNPDSSQEFWQQLLITYNSQRKDK